MSEKDKPCNKCPIERRDACWKGPNFACEEYYLWLNPLGRFRLRSTAEMLKGDS